MRENGVNPHHAEHARAYNNDYRRNEALADSARSGYCVIHKCRQTERKAHDFKFLHACGDDFGVAVEHGEEKVAFEKRESAENKSERERVKRGYVITPDRSGRLARAVILTDERRASGVKRHHYVVNYRVGVLGGVYARNLLVFKFVYAHLNKDVRHGEYSVLNPRGDAEREDFARFFPFVREVFQVEPVSVLYF